MKLEWRGLQMKRRKHGLLLVVMVVGFVWWAILAHDTRNMLHDDWMLHMFNCMHVNVPKIIKQLLYLNIHNFYTFIQHFIFYSISFFLSHYQYIISITPLYLFIYLSRVSYGFGYTPNVMEWYSLFFFSLYLKHNT